MANHNGLIISIFVLIFAFLISTTTHFPLPGLLIIGIIMIFHITIADKKAAKETKKKIGMAGWLLFFTGILALIGITQTTVMISDSIRLAIYAPYQLLTLETSITQIFTLITGTITIVIAAMLWKMRPIAKKLVIGYLIAEIVLITGFMILIPEEMLNISATIILAQGTAMLIYFLKSERVKNTYAENAKLPKKWIKSNRPVIGWLIFQAIIILLLIIASQIMYWVSAGVRV